MDQDGRVIAFNAEASLIAPALRRGEPASIALRMPELVEAMGGRVWFEHAKPGARFVIEFDAA
jgi:hypothetical protein